MGFEVSTKIFGADKIPFVGELLMAPCAGFRPGIYLEMALEEASPRPAFITQLSAPSGPLISLSPSSAIVL